MTSGPKPKLFEFNGRRLSIKEWADELGVGYELIRYRLANGRTIEEALFGNKWKMEIPDSQDLPEAAREGAIKEIVKRYGQPGSPITVKDIARTAWDRGFLWAERKRRMRACERQNELREETK